MTQDTAVTLVFWGIMAIYGISALLCILWAREQIESRRNPRWPW